MNTPLRVLIVEDSKDDAFLLVRALRRGGYEPTFERVDTPAAMTTALNQQTWDIVISDYSMPYFSGLAALKLLKESGLDLPFIILSGAIGEETAVEAMKTGAHDYIMKDNLARLIPAIERELREVEVRREHGMAEKALRESEERLNSFMESATDAFALFDSELNYIEINKAWLEMSDLRKEEVIGKNISEIIPNIKETGRYDKYLEVIKTGKPFFLEDLISHAASGDIYLAMRAFKVGDGFGIIATDITERKRMEQERQKNENLESIGVLAGGIAHDFNNLLTAILGNIALAKMFSNEEEVIERLMEANKASLQARDLTQQLLTFAKGGIPVKEMASISEIIKETAAFGLRGANVKCELTFPEDLWTVEIDKGQISQVIHNLVINADHAMPEGGILKIKAENIIISDKENLPLEEGKYIKIFVEDDGIGIPKEYSSKIFDPYFTIKGMRAQKGTGLGLAVVYSIIKNHEGYITVESEVGVGTTFYIYLPASQKEISEEAWVEERMFSGTGRILVMDDEEIVRDVLGKMLSQLGYDVEFAKDGAEAIKLHPKNKDSGQPFDAVTLDLTIPGGMGGKETIKKLLEIDPKVRAIVSSGYSNDPVISDYKKYGFMGSIAKPYEMRELSEVLRKVIM